MALSLELIPLRWQEPELRFYCWDFGIGALLGSTLLGPELAAAPVIGDVTAGSLLGGSLLGGAEGAAFSGITGGDPLTGALGGFVGGGVGDIAGGAIGEAAPGLSSTVDKALGGALGGVVSSEISGGNPFLGAGLGAAGPIASNALGIGDTAGVTPSATTDMPAAGAGGGTSAVSSTAGITPSGTGASTDLTGGSLPGLNPTGNVGGDFFNGQFTPLSATDTTAPVASGAGGDTSQTLGDFSPRPQTSFGDKALNFIEKNPMALLGLAGLAAPLLMGPSKDPAEAQLQQMQGEAASQARTLAAYQQSGTLPAGLQSIVDQQIAAEKAAIVSQYGSLGLGHSTMATDKLNQLKAQRSAEIASFADKLAQQGISWANLSGQELVQLLKAQQFQDQQFSSALGSFAKGLAGVAPALDKAIAA